MGTYTYTHTLVYLVLYLDISLMKQQSFFHFICQACEAWKAGPRKVDYDPVRFEGSDLKQIQRCMQIGLLCAQSDRARRPNMAEVLEMLYDNKILPNPGWSSIYYSR